MLGLMLENATVQRRRGFVAPAGGKKGVLNGKCDVLFVLRYSWYNGTKKNTSQHVSEATNASFTKKN